MTDTNTTIAEKILKEVRALRTKQLHEVMNALRELEALALQLQPQEPTVDPVIEDVHINDLQFDARTRGCLVADGIDSLHAIVRKTETELLQIPKFGKKSLEHVKAKVAEYGLFLRPEGSRLTSIDLVGELELTVRTEQDLKAHNILIVAQLLTKTKADLGNLTNPKILQKSIQELQDVLACHGHYIGCQL